jgi:hypothetical protein
VEQLKSEAVVCYYPIFRTSVLINSSCFLVQLPQFDSLVSHLHCMQEEALYVLKNNSPEEAFKIFTKVVLL